MFTIRTSDYWVPNQIDVVSVLYRCMLRSMSGVTGVLVRCTVCGPPSLHLKKDVPKKAQILFNKKFTEL